MKIHVRFYNILSAYAGVKTLEVVLVEGTSLAGLLRELVQLTPPAFGQVIQPDGVFNPHIRIFINGNLIVGAAEEIQLADGDAVMLFPAIAGGGF